MLEGLSFVHLALVLVILVVELGIPLLLSFLVARWWVQHKNPDPRVVLAERLTRGEISREEFDAGMRAFVPRPSTVTWGSPPASPPAKPVEPSEPPGPPT